MLQAMLELYKKVISLPTSNTFLAFRIAENNKYKTYFSDYFEALNRTHIDIYITPIDQPR
jgi:hypothetical protein